MKTEKLLSTLADLVSLEMEGCTVHFTEHFGAEDVEQIRKVGDLNAELLKALKDTTETLESCVGGSDPLHYEDVKDEIEKAESVIKKATKQKSI